MKSFVVSQVIQAVIVIVVTAITVRLTMFGSLGVSQSTKLKFRAIALHVITFWLDIAVIAFAIYKLVTFISPYNDTPTSRVDVLLIAFWTAIFFRSFDHFMRELLRAKARKWGAPPPEF